jgi:hypothetical protein
MKRMENLGYQVDILQQPSGAACWNPFVGFTLASMEASLSAGCAALLLIAVGIKE